MLELKNIVKNYAVGDTVVRALKGINITFRQSEFVSILGPSGCGKTTMLNIVGGLDKYTSGDLVINGKSTKDYKDYDWDTYRNRSIGFVFQNYNLIPHLTVLGNVELALTLSGEPSAVRKEKAIKALTAVGLESQIYKRPNQMSGGQMQRVAIARAIVNNPDIILADEPTGALDSTTSIQIIDLLKEISKDRLIIMVTHNDDIALKYSTRIIKLLDGEKVSDSHPYEPSPEELKTAVRARKLAKNEYIKENDATILSDEKLAMLDAKRTQEYTKTQKKAERARLKERRKALRKTSMGFNTALSLSGRNLATKKGRTALVSFAGSIGIIGIALVLSISNGFNIYITKMQTDTLAGFPITISQTAMTMNMSQTGGIKVDKIEYPTDDKVNIYSQDMSSMVHLNKLNKSYDDHLKKLDSSLYNDMQYTYSSDFVILTNNGSKVLKVKRSIKSASVSMGDSSMNQSSSVMGELLPNQDFINTQYDILGSGKYPSGINEAALVVDKYNRLSKDVFEALGISTTDKTTFNFDDLIGKEYRAVKAENVFKSSKNILGNEYYPSVIPTADETTGEINYDFTQMYNLESNIPIKITAIMRVKESAPLDLMGTGLFYSPALTSALIDSAITAPMGVAQLANPDYSYVYGLTYDEILKNLALFPGLGSLAQFKPTKEFMQIQDLNYFGITKVPASIYIYPKDFDSKAKINTHLNAYNDGKSDADKILYTDASELLASTMGNMVDIISYVLVAFAAVSLVVSSIMIGIITYVSVIERTKEIGVLRSIGARKKDISRVFNAETMLIGLAAGVLGVAVSFLLNFPINWIINAVINANGAAGMGIGNLAILNPLHGLILIVVSVCLTLISGLVPARIAAKKDPVVALRTE